MKKLMKSLFIAGAGIIVAVAFAYSQSTPSQDIIRKGSGMGTQEFDKYQDRHDSIARKYQSLRQAKLSQERRVEYAQADRSYREADASQLERLRARHLQMAEKYDDQYTQRVQKLKAKRLAKARQRKQHKQNYAQEAQQHKGSHLAKTHKPKKHFFGKGNKQEHFDPAYAYKQDYAKGSHASKDKNLAKGEQLKNQYGKAARKFSEKNKKGNSWLGQWFNR